MFELVVASGKGGTGKTSLVGALAEVVGAAVLVDCDVDAANLHLIVAHEVREEHKFLSGHRASVDFEKCIACNICSDNCRFNAIRTTPDPDTELGVRISVDPLACEGCALCSRLCPTQAIEMVNVVSGTWFQSQSACGPFLHARLGIAQSNSGRLVSLLRQRAQEVAAEREMSTIIVDGPPGIGCPVIAALTGASYLLIVTEPSLSAIHDMERLADLAAHFKIKTGLCINKFDINETISSKIEQIARDRGLQVHGKIPYDPAFVRAQLQGQSYMKTGSDRVIDTIRKVWRGIVSDAGTKGHSDEHRFAV